VKDVPSSFSNSLDKANPDGVKNTPSGFFEYIFSSSISPGLGNVLLFLEGMNTRLDSKSFKYFGGR